VVCDQPLVLPFSGEARDVVIVGENQVTADFGVIGAPANWMEV
jgi:hypothetical protein